jgi:hypothetical protein
LLKFLRRFDTSTKLSAGRLTAGSAPYFALKDGLRRASRTGNRDFLPHILKFAGLEFVDKID